MKNHSLLMVVLCAGLVISGVGCKSTQVVSGDGNVPKEHLSKILITSGDLGSGLVTIASIDGIAVDASKKYAAIAMGPHELAVHFQKEIDRERGHRTALKVSVFGQELTEPDQPDKVLTVSSKVPEIISFNFEGGKKYYLHSTDTFAKVEKVYANRWENELYSRLDDPNAKWELTGSVKIEVREQ